MIPEPDSDGAAAVTELHEALARIRSDFDQYRRAVDEHAIVSMTDAAGTIIFANDKFCAICGYTREELLGQNHRIIKSGIHPPDFYWEMWHTISNGRVWHGEVCNRHKEGHFYWVYATIVPLFGADGRPERYLSIRTDITPIKLQERLLRQRDERLRRIQAYANIGLWEWDVARNTVYWSARLAALFGFPEEDQETAADTFFAAFVPEERDEVVAKLRASLIRPAPFEMTHRVLHPDGTVVAVRMRGGVQRDETGQPTRLLGVVQVDATCAQPHFMS